MGWFWLACGLEFKDTRWIFVRLGLLGYVLIVDHNFLCSSRATYLR